MTTASQHKPPAAPTAEQAVTALIRATAAAIDALAQNMGHHGKSPLHSLVLLGADREDAELLRQYLARQDG